MSRIIPISLALLFSFMFLGCGTGDEASLGQHSFTITEETGVRVAESVGGPRYAGELFRYEKILEIRPDSTQPDSYLARPTHIVMDDEGRFYVADRGNHRIVVYEQDGRYRTTIGRGGFGPGDLMNPYSLRIRGDTLFVYQFFQPARLTLFRTDGSCIDVITSTWQSMSRYAGTTLPHLTWAEDGSLIESLYQQDLVSDRQSSRLLVRTKSASGDSLTTLVVGSIDTDQMISFDELGHRSLTIRFNGFPCAVYRGGGQIAVTTGLEPVIRCFDLSGRLTKEVRLDLPPSAVTTQDRRSLFEYLDGEYRGLAEELGEQDIRTRWARYERDHPILPGHKAYWCYLYYDDAGRYWLQIPEAGGRVFPSNHCYSYRILSAEGEYLGDTICPPMAEALGLGSGVQQNLLLTLVENPDTGERIPTVFRISPTVGGPPF